MSWVGELDEMTASGGALALIDRSDGQVIGTTRFEGYDPEAGQVEIGWTLLARSRWGGVHAGAASTLGRRPQRGGVHNGAMKDLMLRDSARFVSTVVFRVHAGNFSSRRAVEKLGAVWAGNVPDRSGRGETYVHHLDVSPLEF